MKRFLIRTFLFLFISGTLISATIFVLNIAVGRGKYFKINPEVTSIIMGPSFPAYSFNDKLIKHFENLAQGGEAYYYTYYKLKKILENNPQIQNVFIEYSNMLIDKEMDNWIWNNANIENRFPKYGSFIDLPGLILLSSHNPSAVLNGFSLSLKFNFDFLVENKHNYIKQAFWDGPHNLYVSQIDSLKKTLTKNRITRKNSTYQLSYTNIRYLEKIVKYTRDQNIHIYFIRSPLHPEFHAFDNESEYRQILSSRFPDIELLDFKKFYLPDAYFKDFAHLNYKGARVFSIFFNKLVEGGLLFRPNKQEVIDSAMSASNKNLNKIVHSN